MPGFAPRYMPPKAGAGVGTDSVTIVPAGSPPMPLLSDVGIPCIEPLLQPQADVDTGIIAEVPWLSQPQPLAWPMPPSRIGPPLLQASQSFLPNPKCFLWNIPRPSIWLSSQPFDWSQLWQPVRPLSATARVAKESSIFMIVHSIPTKRRDHPRGWDGYRRDSAGTSLLAGLTLTGVEELYITLHDVQPPHENFLQPLLLFGNTRGISVLKFSSDSKLHGSDRLSGYKIWPEGCFCVRMQRAAVFECIPQDCRYVFIDHSICSPSQACIYALGPRPGFRGAALAVWTEFSARDRRYNNRRPTTRCSLRRAEYRRVVDQHAGAGLHERQASRNGSGAALLAAR